MSGPVTPPRPSPGNEPRPSGPGPGPGAGGIRFPRWLWIAIFVGLLVWNAFLFLAPMSGPVVTDPLLHVPRPGAGPDNVAAVTINGQAVTGTFRAAIQYPSPDPSSLPDAIGGYAAAARRVVH